MRRSDRCTLVFLRTLHWSRSKVPMSYRSTGMGQFLSVPAASHHSSIPPGSRPPHEIVNGPPRVRQLSTQKGASLAQYTSGARVPILLQKSFGVASLVRAQNAIPTRARSRMGIPGRSHVAECDSISRAAYQTSDRLLQQNLPERPQRPAGRTSVADSHRSSRCRFR